MSGKRAIGQAVPPATNEPGRVFPTIDLDHAAYRLRPAPREAPVVKREPLTFSDGMLFLAAAAVLIEIATGRHGLAGGIVLFGGLVRLKLLLRERVSTRVPDWLLFVIPSAALWIILFFLV